jgi:hypothetical protein
MKAILTSWLRISIVAVARLLMGVADTAVSAGPNPQDACRHGGVSAAVHWAFAADVAAGAIVDRTRRQSSPVARGAARGKETLIGDASPAPERPPAGQTLPQGALEPLDEAALRRVLYGNYVWRDMTGILDAGGTEFFCSDGGWPELGGRVSFGGSFTISNGVVCVQHPRESRCCRRFYVDVADRYF